MLTVALRVNLFAYSYVRNKFGYNVVTVRITTPDLYCSASRKPITWTQKAPMHRWTVNKTSSVRAQSISVQLERLIV